MAELTYRQKFLIEKHEWSLVTCLNSLFCCFRLQAAEAAGRLPGDLPTKNLFVEFEGDPPSFYMIRAATKPVEMYWQLENIKLNVAAICFLQFDEMARQKLGRERFIDENEDTKNTCIILYLIRCAFAHNPLIPTWRIAPRFQNKIFSIPSIGITLDTSGLEGTIGVVPKIMGWGGALNLLEHAFAIISPSTAQTMNLNNEK